MWWLRRLPWLRRGRGGEVKAPSNPLVGLVKDVREDDRGISLTGVIWSPGSAVSRPSGSGDGTSVGIVHSMSSDRAPIVAGQDVFSKGTRVMDRKGGPKKLVYEGSVLHYDASPGYESAVVRWDSGIVTVEKAEDLGVIL